MKKSLKNLTYKFETKIISAHRTPIRMYKYAANAEKNNIAVIIAGAGGSAHLPGMISALTSIARTWVFQLKVKNSKDLIVFYQ